MTSARSDGHRHDLVVLLLQMLLLVLLLKFFRCKLSPRMADMTDDAVVAVTDDCDRVAGAVGVCVCVWECVCMKKSTYIQLYTVLH